ncbi:MAG: tetratricopeptide repeat protein [Flavobacteriales bacterium]
MKNRIFLVPIILMLLIGCNNSRKSQIEDLTETFSRTVEMGDYLTSISVMNQIITLDSLNLDYHDTLAVLYYNTKMYTPAIVSAESVLRKKESQKMTALLIKCYEAIGDFESVAGHYKLKVEKNPDDLAAYYEFGLSSFYANQFKSSLSIMNHVLKMPMANSSTVKISTGRIVEKVPYNAAALNVIGLSLLSLGDTTSAKRAFSEALKVYPYFELADENLKILNQAK